jgi:hypothetical protein
MKSGKMFFLRKILRFRSGPVVAGGCTSHQFPFSGHRYAHGDLNGRQGAWRAIQCIFYIEMPCQEDFQCVRGSKDQEVHYFFGQAKFCVLFSHGTTGLGAKILLIKQGSGVLNLQSQVEKIKTAACHEVLSAIIFDALQFHSNLI